MVKINKNQHITKDGVVKRNPTQQAVFNEFPKEITSVEPIFGYDVTLIKLKTTKNSILYNVEYDNGDGDGALFIKNKNNILYFEMSDDRPMQNVSVGKLEIASKYELFNKLSNLTWLEED